MPTWQGRHGAAFRWQGISRRGHDGPEFDYRDPFTIAAWIKPEAATGRDCFARRRLLEGQQHGLYLMDGKLRLHVTFRWTDLAMRWRRSSRCRLHEWQSCRCYL